MTRRNPPITCQSCGNIADTEYLPLADWWVCRLCARMERISSPMEIEPGMLINIMGKFYLVMEVWPEGDSVVILTTQRFPIRRRYNEACVIIR